MEQAEKAAVQAICYGIRALTNAVLASSNTIPIEKRLDLTTKANSHLRIMGECLEAVLEE